MKVLQVMKEDGNDRYDTSLTEEFLTENGSYDIKDPVRVAARYLNNMLYDMRYDMRYDNGIVSIRLEEIPSIDEIIFHVKKKKDFTVTSKPDENGNHELEFTWHGKDAEAISSYAYGQIEHRTSFTERDIPDEDVRYLVVENFLCPRIGTPSVQRLRFAPFHDLVSAQLAIDGLQIDKNAEWRKGISSVKELIIADAADLEPGDQDNFMNLACYKLNMEVLKARQQGVEGGQAIDMKAELENLRNCLKT